MKENKPIEWHIIFFVFLILVILCTFMGKVVFWLAWTSYWDYLEAQGKLPTVTELSPTIVKTTLEKPPVASKVVEKVKEPVKEVKAPVEPKIDTLWVKAWTGQTFTDQDNARLERIAICEEMYEKHKDRITNKNDVVIRCATMMTLQYAFESGHGKSKKCVYQKNCYWIKNNKRDRCIKSNNWFCTYSAQIEWSRDYAEMFMKHYEGYKSVTAYLHVYSPDGNNSYHKFVLSKYKTTFEWFKNNPPY